MKLTLRTRLALMYGAFVALTASAFGVVTFLTVQNELYANLDASLSRAAVSLRAVINREQEGARRPLAPVRRGRNEKKTAEDVFAFLQRSSMRNFVGPILVPDSVFEQREDPIWSAVYEHVLLNSSTYVLQASSPDGDVVWRSDNLLADSLPRFEYFADRGVPVVDGNVYTDYTQNGIRYRLVISSGEVAEIAAAYPVEEIDKTLQGLFALMLYSIPVLIFVSVIGGWFLARRALKPVDILSRSARRITAQRLSERLPDLQTNDEIARLTSTLNDMIARLEGSFEQIKQFTSDASHELKTPLAILMGELEIALRSPGSEEDIRATLLSCLEEVERLNNVVQGLLELSRAETGQVVLDRKMMNLSAMARDICEDIEILAEPKGINVVTSIEPGIIISGDSVRLHQALLNLIENAIKYTPAGGMVSVELSADNHRATIRIHDTGVGIPEEQLPYIYDRFYRVDKARSQRVQGTGLGLSIVKWVVESHDGQIIVSSEEGKGTSFMITIPRFDDAPSQ